MANPSPSKAATTSEVLLSLDNQHQAVGRAVSQGQYAFWLGSGLSKGVVPDVGELLKLVLRYLQERVTQGDQTCTYRQCISTILLEIAKLPTDHGIDLDQAIDCWPDLEGIIRALWDSYATVLDVSTPGNEDEDFLIWDAINVTKTYGNPALEPNASHLCLAILILEGVAKATTTTNWDGLVESAVKTLHGSVNDVLSIMVHKDEFRQAGAPLASLVKFHGCAVLAADQPDRYRSLLIARESQIVEWTSDPEYSIVVDHLTQLLAIQPTLVIGLSGQDANIHAVFTRAKQKLQWQWPSNPAAIVFALKRFTPTQKLILKLVYGSNYNANRESIEKSALLGVYAQPLLTALVLYTLCEKLCSVVRLNAHDSWSDADVKHLELGLHNIRDLVGDNSDPESVDFTHKLAATISLILRVFRQGEAPDLSSSVYEPLTTQPVNITQTDPNVDLIELRNLATIASVLGRGAAEERWELRPGSKSAPAEGVLMTNSDNFGPSKVFLVKNDQVLSNLQANGTVDLEDPDVLVLHAQPMLETQSRSPSLNPGRSLNRAGRQLSIVPILDDAIDADDIFERFAQEAAI